MTDIVISGTGIFTPPDAISNEELVSAYNQYVTKYNTEHKSEIEAGTLEEKMPSSVEFIEKASGIKSRYLMEGRGILDVNKMHPGLSIHTPDDYLGVPAQVYMAKKACEDAMERAGVKASDIDLVIMACSTVERIAPAMSCHLQEELGTGGFAFDMAMGCSSATFGISTAMDALKSGMATRALVVTAEYVSPAMNYCDRDSHFIFGDAAVAMVLEKQEDATSDKQFRINSRELFTEFSTNINAGFGLRTLLERDKIDDDCQRFLQNGRVVFKELLPKVINLVESHLDKNNLSVADMRRMWLHQANINMNTFATKKLLGTNPTQDTAPIILDEFANTAGAGCMIAFHRHSDDLKAGDKGMICSFGASYSIGCLVVEKL